MKLRYPLSAAALYAVLCWLVARVDMPLHQALGVALLSALVIPAVLIAWARALEARK